ncbi:sortase [Streptomyces sp. NPDC051219]|uniref:sortase n=1 Tax=Streptomyces sp. NPDC051219 TaxID=3155283 RepID=UPI00343A88D7
MRKARVVTCTGLVLGALGLSVQAAAAVGDSDIHIHPRNASPGSTVTVSTTACGPEVSYGKGQSDAGGAFHLFEGDRKGVLTGEFKLPEGVRAGSDTVTLKCPPRIKVTDTYQVTDRPSGAVDAGFGVADDQGTQIALGGALLAAAAAGGVVRMRRRPSGVRT